MKKRDFDKLKEELQRLAKASDSSEQHNVLDFLTDVVDNIQYDVKAGNYKNADVKRVLREHMVGCLEQFEEHIGYLKKYLKENVT